MTQFFLPNQAHIKKMLPDATKKIMKSNFFRKNFFHNPTSWDPLSNTTVNTAKD